MDNEDAIYTHTYIYTHIHTYIYIHIHIKKYYSAIKKNKTLPSATWMDLEGIMLSERSQTEKDKYHMISLTGEI